MQSILEALARWRPPDGTIRSVTVEVDRVTSAHTAMVMIERSRDNVIPVLLTLGYADALNMTMSAIAHKLTALALDAYAAAASPVPKSANIVKNGPEKLEKHQGKPAA